MLVVQQIVVQVQGSDGLGYLGDAVFTAHQLHILKHVPADLVRVQSRH